jgi:hypothetical protein
MQQSSQFTPQSIWRLKVMQCVGKSKLIDFNNPAAVDAVPRGSGLQSEQP